MIRVVEKNGKKVTIIGTAHISSKSRDQVKEIIENEKPNVVGIELDASRFYAMMSGKKSTAKFTDAFRSRKPFLFLLQYFLSKYQKKIAADFNMEPGEEMKQAALSAKVVGARILLADRDVNITLQKLYNALTFREKLRLLNTGFKMQKELGKDISVQKILSEAEAEDSEFINKIMEILERRHKKLKQALIDERDEFMAYNIQQVLKDENVTNVVLVVGAGHTNGIVKNLDNENIDIKSILSVKKEKKIKKKEN